MENLYEDIDVSSSGPLQLTDFIKRYRNWIPLRASVAKSVFGIGKNDLLTKGQLVDIHCLKETKVLDIEEQSCSRRKFILPINTDLSCSVVHGESADGKHKTFEGAGQLMTADPQPKVVAVQKRTKTLSSGDVLAIKETHSNHIICYNFNMKKEIIVSKHSQILFTTEICMLKISLPALFNHVKLPAKLVFFSNDPRTQQSLSCIYNAASTRLLKSLIASFHPINPTTVAQDIVEIFEYAPISLEFMESTAESNEKLLANGKLVAETFVPFLLKDSLVDVSATGCALQERLLSPELTTEELWSVGVTITVPRAAVQCQSENKKKKHTTHFQSNDVGLDLPVNNISQAGTKVKKLLHAGKEIGDIQSLRPVSPQHMPDDEYTSLLPLRMETSNEYVSKLPEKAELGGEKPNIYCEVRNGKSLPIKDISLQRQRMVKPVLQYHEVKSPRHHEQNINPNSASTMISTKSGTLPEKEQKAISQVTQNQKKLSPIRHIPPAIAKKPQKKKINIAQPVPLPLVDKNPSVMDVSKSEITNLGQNPLKLKTKEDGLESGRKESEECVTFNMPSAGIYGTII